MRKMFYILFAAVALFVSGCGEDRSHGVFNLSPQGEKLPWIYESDKGQKMVENNFIYIPGGFDVDGDDEIDGGFWLAKYEAREDNNKTFDAINVNNLDGIDELLRENFKVYNPDSEYQKFDKFLPANSGYSQNLVSTIEKSLYLPRVIFNDKSETEIIKSISPLEAVISLQNSQVQGGSKIALPTEKQWMHLVQLVVNNPKNWVSHQVGVGKLYQGSRDGAKGREFVFENSLLGDDELVPPDYSRVAYDLAGSVSEWTSGMVYKGDRFLTGNSLKNEYQTLNNAPQWWKPILKDGAILISTQGAGQYHDGSSLDGANNTLFIKIDKTLAGDVDNYAVVARGGSSSDDDSTLVGIGAAKLNYGAGYKGPTVGFRAASGYF